MSVSEILRRYARMARAAGTEVEFTTADELPVRLASLLAGLHAEAAVSPRARLAAVPIHRWPEGLRELAVDALKSAGHEITTQKEISGRFNWDRSLLEKAFIGVTYCPVFLADTGSIVMTSGAGMGALAGLLPEVHIALSCAEGCRENLGDYLREVGHSLPSRLTLITGPSRTGDIECAMTVGVHGPGRVAHFILQKSPAA